MTAAPEVLGLLQVHWFANAASGRGLSGSVQADRTPCPTVSSSEPPRPPGHPLAARRPYHACISCPDGAEDEVWGHGRLQGSAHLALLTGPGFSFQLTLSSSFPSPSCWQRCPSLESFERAFGWNCLSSSCRARVYTCGHETRLTITCSLIPVRASTGGQCPGSPPASQSQRTGWCDLMCAAEQSGPRRHSDRRQTWDLNPGLPTPAHVAAEPPSPGCRVVLVT